MWAPFWAYKDVRVSENFGGYNKHRSIMENALKYFGHWTPIATWMIVIYAKSMKMD